MNLEAALTKELDALPEIPPGDWFHLYPASVRPDTGRIVEFRPIAHCGHVLTGKVPKFKQPPPAGKRLCPDCARLRGGK